MNSCISRGSTDRDSLGFAVLAPCVSHFLSGSSTGVWGFSSDGNGDRCKMAKQKDLRPLGPQAWNCHPITSASFYWPKQVTCPKKIKAWENMSPF